MNTDIFTEADDETGLPLVRSWRAVYVMVLIMVAIYVIGLAILSGHSW